MAGPEQLQIHSALMTGLRCDAELRGTLAVTRAPVSPNGKPRRAERQRRPSSAPRPEKWLTTHSSSTRFAE